MKKLQHKRRIIIAVLSVLMVFSAVTSINSLLSPVSAYAAEVTDMTSFKQNGNILTFDCGGRQVIVELCTKSTCRIQLSMNGSDGYRPYDPEYYMVNKLYWDEVKRTVTDSGNTISVKTDAMEIRIEKSPFRIGMYDLDGNLISKDSSPMYQNGSQVGVKKVEGSINAGGIFGFGTNDHGRTTELNRYEIDYNDFTMQHGQLTSPFFMSTVGYGIFLNTLSKNTVFFKHGGGFETGDYLDYFFMYGPDFSTILNEYAEITGRMELYGKWAHGFMLSKYGNDNATQAEFIEWLNRLRDEGYPCDVYVFDYGWRGDIADNGGNQTGAGQKWGKQMWSNDTSKFPDIAQMFEIADELGFKVGLHNNAGTPEASGGDKLYLEEYYKPWVESYMNVIKAGYGDFFWPDEFDVLGSNTAPVFAAKYAYEAWQNYTDESRPMFMSRGGYAGQHYATAWSGDIENTSYELGQQIGYGIQSGLIGYWTTSNDLGGFKKRPTNELYTRWVAEFGAWSGLMRTHGHDGREPWTYDETAQETLKKNLKIRYSLYPYTYTTAWQGYSQGVPMMRAMILQDDGRTNKDVWNIDRQYYYGDWFLVAPACDTTATVVPVYLPANTTWYDYLTGERYEGGAKGKTIKVAAELDEIPVFVKAGAIVPMGPDVNYADEVPLNPLTLDIYPHGRTQYTLFEDDGVSRKYITQNAYTETTYTSIQDGKNISFNIGKRINHNASVYTPDDRSYNLKFNNMGSINGVKLNGKNLDRSTSVSQYNDSAESYYYDGQNKILYVKIYDTGLEMTVTVDGEGVVQPELGDENQGVPVQKISSGDLFELENSKFLPASGGLVTADAEWKGYTGTGFAKGFKAVGDTLEFTVNIVREGNYDLVLRVNNGKKGSAQYDSTPRTAGLYMQNTKIYNLSFNVTETWGDSSKNGVWVNYTVPDVHLTAGEHTFKIVSEGSNPGNFNLDSMQFLREDTSINAFTKIEAESASYTENMTVVKDGTATALYIQSGGAWAQYSEVNGDYKGGVELRLKSTTGGSIIVYENGVGDKILATAEIPTSGKWETIRVDSKNTDENYSNIFLEFNPKDGQNISVLFDYFRFIRKVDAYKTIQAVDAEVRNGINTREGKLVNIEDGDSAVYKDLNFGEGVLTSVSIVAGVGKDGGIVEIYTDDIYEGIKIASINLTNTGSWSNYQTFTSDCAAVTGVHNIVLLFKTSSGNSICDLSTIRFTRTVQVDKTALSQAIAQAEGVDLTKYTQESVEVLNSALNSAKELYENNSATQTQVDDMTARLNEAILNLVEKVDDTDSESQTTEKPKPAKKRGCSSNVKLNSMGVLSLVFALLGYTAIKLFRKKDSKEEV